MQLVVNLILSNIFLLGVCWLGMRYGKPVGDRWVDKCHRLINYTFPSLARSLFGKRPTSIFSRMWNYTVHTRNPLVVVLYLFLTIGGYIGFILSGYPYLPNSTLTFSYHKELGFLIFCLSLIFFSQAATSDPGVIDKSNHSFFYKQFPFDGHVFRRNETCSTCEFAKPARSKHCRVCNHHVAKFDHHCIWINQCVGIGNARSFLLFVVTNNVMCLYGAYLGLGILYDRVETQGLQNAWFRDSVSGTRFRASWYYICVYLLASETLLCYVTIICAILGVFLLTFTWYHWITLGRLGLTTNEEAKLGTLTVRSERERFLKTYSAGSWMGNIKSMMRGRE